MNKKQIQLINFLIGPTLFIFVFYLPLEGLSAQGQAVLAATLWTAYWWITEPVELAVTSILPILLFPLSGALTVKQTTTSYGNPYIFLFMGGFILGLAIEKWNLHKRIAYGIIKKMGTGEKKVLLGFMVATAFLSMWISNSATAIMMLPIGTSVASQLGKGKRFSKKLMLSIAYAASIGGMVTLIGTPPNVIFAGIIKSTMGVEISFLDWMLFATPFSIILLFIAWLYLSRGKKNEETEKTAFLPENLGEITSAEKRVALVFGLTAILWVSRSFLINPYFPIVNDTLIAIFGALLLFVVPSGINKEKLMTWNVAKNLPWDVLLIFGAGLSIAKGFSQTDLTKWLAGHFSTLEFLPIALIAIIIIAAINFITEITSNTATASIMLPILYSLSLSLNLPTLSLLACATLSASCAFMLPVATPPNAIVFSSGNLKVKDMVRAGFALNIFSISLLFIFMQWVWALIF